MTLNQKKNQKLLNLGLTLGRVVFGVSSIGLIILASTLAPVQHSRQVAGLTTRQDNAKACFELGLENMAAKFEINNEGQILLSDYIQNKCQF